MTPEEFRSTYPFAIDGKVEWGDMDAFGHVNNTMFFRYFERVRMDFMEQVGFMKSMADAGIGPILASTRCRFRSPLEYPDAIITGTFVTDIEDDRFLMHYGLYSHRLAGVAAEGDGLIVCFDYGRGRKTSLPESIRARLDVPGEN